MKTQLKQTIVSSSILLMAFASAYITGCAKVDFSPSPQDCGSGCISIQGQYDYSYDVKASKADILFVVDNSASMSPLQSQMASKFSNFINQIKNLDYQIGVTTTDVTNNSAPYTNAGLSTPAPINGQLARFSDGSTVLNGSHDVATESNYFITAVTRPETAACQNYIYPLCTGAYGTCTGPLYSQKCPSEDTRAIKAASLALSVNNSSGLFRGKDVPLNVVLLSNADERTAGGRQGYAQLDSSDQPQSLIANVQAQFPGKQLKIHSIIIKDDACLANQNQNTKNPARNIFGWKGNIYDQAASSTMGVSQSICGNFDLSAIGSSVIADDGSRDLACHPKTGTLQVTLNGAATTNYSVVTTSSGGYRLKFNSALPANTSVHVTFSCQ
jgi:hypothetical protein